MPKLYFINYFINEYFKTVKHNHPFQKTKCFFIWNFICFLRVRFVVSSRITSFADYYYQLMNQSVRNVMYVRLEIYSRVARWADPFLNPLYLPLTFLLRNSAFCHQNRWLKICAASYSGSPVGGGARVGGSSEKPSSLSFPIPSSCSIFLSRIFLGEDPEKWVEESAGRGEKEGRGRERKKNERRSRGGDVLYFEREWCLDDKPQVVASVEFFLIYPRSGKKRAALSVLVNVQTRRWRQVLLAVKSGLISTMSGLVGYLIRIRTSASC